MAEELVDKDVGGTEVCHTRDGRRQLGIVQVLAAAASGRILAATQYPLTLAHSVLSFPSSGDIFCSIAISVPLRAPNHAKFVAIFPPPGRRSCPHRA